MSRLMSVAMTTQAVIDRRKTVTRRVGWWTDKNSRHLLKTGDWLTLCAKVQGRKPGEPLVRLAEVEVTDVRRESLADLLRADNRADAQMEIVREGFPGMDPAEFVDRFFVQAQGLAADAVVTRIAWCYLDREAPTRGRVWTDNVRVDGGGIITSKRACNGCARLLGDVLDAELEAAINGRSLPDVRDECGCGGAP